MAPEQLEGKRGRRASGSVAFGAALQDHTGRKQAAAATLSLISRSRLAPAAGVDDDEAAPAALD
jgi:hypothetical protein